MVLNKKGFTLIELLVAISIVGTLSASITTSLEEIRKSARDTVRISDIQQVALAMEITKDVFSDEYRPISNTTPQAIGTELPEVPTNNSENGGIYGWIDNTTSPQLYCAWAVLEEGSDFGRYYVSTPRGAGFMDEEPTDFESCVFYEENSFDTGNENELDIDFVCHVDKKGRARTLNVDPGRSAGHANIAQAHLDHGDLPHACP